MSNLLDDPDLDRDLAEGVPPEPVGVVQVDGVRDATVTSPSMTLVASQEPPSP